MTEPTPKDWTNEAQARDRSERMGTYCPRAYVFCPGVPNEYLLASADGELSTMRPFSTPAARAKHEHEADQLYLKHWPNDEW